MAPSALMSTATTVAPSSASRSATAHPIPCAAPDTTATRSSNLCTLRPLNRRSWSQWALWPSSSSPVQARRACLVAGASTERRTSLTAHCRHCGPDRGSSVLVRLIRRPAFKDVRVTRGLRCTSCDDRGRCPWRDGVGGSAVEVSPPWESVGLRQLTPDKEGSWPTLEAAPERAVDPGRAVGGWSRACIDDIWTIEADRGAVPGRREDGAQVARPVPRRGRGRAAGSISRPHRSPNQTPPKLRDKVLQLRRRHRWGADHIAHETGLAASTVQAHLERRRCRPPRPRRPGRREPVRRYQRDRPGELIHVDVKKIAGDP